MTMKIPPMKILGFLTADKALGVAGGSLALASASFAVYMNVNGPARSASGHDFTVFAQLAPRATPSTTRPELGRPDPDEDLDTAVTASIPRRATVSAGPRGGTTGDAASGDTAPGRSTNPAVTLQTAAADGATIAVGGRSRLVHVGDTIPGAGEVLAILPGLHPAVRTSQGLILVPGDK